MAQVTDERLKELERLEERMLALEAGGVDNWGGYDDALEPIRQRDRHDNFLQDILGNILGMMAGERYEPSERGAGWTVTESCMDRIVRYLRTLNIPASPNQRGVPARRSK